MSNDIMVSVRGLAVRYPTRYALRPDRHMPRAVEEASFDIPRGSTLALVGESGSGKTTVARALLRLVEPEKGEIRFAGMDLRVLHGELLRRRRQQMQIVFQDPYASLNPRLIVGRAVAEGLVVHGLASERDAFRRAEDLLAEVGLERTISTRFPHELSGGQRQRVAIARALAVQPDFVILDEAVSALDVTTQVRILDLLERLRADRRLTYLFISHNLAVVQRFATHVAVMYFGRIVESAPITDLFAEPRHPYTQALLRAVPSLVPRRSARALPLGDHPSARALPAQGCPFYPRCPHPEKDSACTAAIPPLGDLAHTHRVACVKARHD